MIAGGSILTCEEVTGWDSGSGTCLSRPGCRATPSCRGWCWPWDWRPPSVITDISHYQTELDGDCWMEQELISFKLQSPIITTVWAAQLGTHVDLISFEPTVEIFYESLLRHLVQLAQVGPAQLRLRSWGSRESTGAAGLWKHGRSLIISTIEAGGSDSQDSPDYWPGAQIKNHSKFPDY